jgi:hypothetical protein
MGAHPREATRGKFSNGITEKEKHNNKERQGAIHRKRGVKTPTKA